MLRSSVDETQPVVVSYAEALLIVVTFVSIFLFLYPKEMLRSLVMTEKSNYDLTAIYLQNMIRINPNDTELLITMCRVGIASKKFALTQRLLDLLKQNSDLGVQNRAWQLQYELYKRQYELTHDPMRQENMVEKMEDLVQQVAKLHHFSVREADYWYHQAIARKRYKEALVFLAPLIDRKDSGGQLVWLKACFYIATKIGDTQKRDFCLNRLLQLDKTDRIKWEKAAYFLSIDQKEYDKAKHWLMQLAAHSREWKQELAAFYTQQKRFKEASDIYMELFLDETNPQKKREYLLRALQVLEYGHLYDKAVAIAKAYEESYLNDTKMMARFLSLYLAANRLKAAKALSDKLFHRIEKR